MEGSYVEGRSSSRGDGRFYGTDGQPLDTHFTGTPVFTIGTEGAGTANTINVGVVLKDANGDALASKEVVDVWLSSAAGGTQIGVTAPNGAVAIGTDGVIITAFVAKMHFKIVTSAAGAFDLNIADTTTPTFYLNVGYRGKVYSSGAITFA